MRYSFRTSLTLWNIGTIVLVLLVFGASLIFANLHRLEGDLDRQLEDQARRASRGGPAPRPPGPPPPPGFEPPPPPLPEAFQEASRVGDLRRPRFFDAGMHSLGRFRDEPFDKAALKVALAGRPVWTTVQQDNHQVRVISWPVLQPGGEAAALQLGRELDDLEFLRRAQFGTLGLFVPLAVLAAAAGALILTSRSLAPIKALTKAASEITHTDLSKRIPVRGEDEMSELTITVNEMIARLERSFTDLSKAYTNLEGAFENQRRFTADASHELRTPLTRLRLATTSALSGAGDAESLKAALQVADKAAISMTALVQQLLTLAKADAGQLGLQLAPVDLRVVVADALELFLPAAEKQLKVEAPDHAITVLGDPEHLQRVVINIVENAFRYAGPHCRIAIRCWSAQSGAILEIADDGPGIAPEHVEKIWDRFYRVDDARAVENGGSGLGLAICRSIVEAHRGRIKIESRLGQGTIVSIWIPSPE